MRITEFSVPDLQVSFHLSSTGTQQENVITAALFPLRKYIQKLQQQGKKKIISDVISKSNSYLKEIHNTLYQYHPHPYLR